MIKDTSGPAFPADIPRINTVTPVTSLSPAPVTLDAIQRIVREELRANAALEAAARQALGLICSARLCEVNSMSSRQEMLRLLIEAADALRAALKEEA